MMYAILLCSGQSYDSHGAVSLVLRKLAILTSFSAIASAAFAQPEPVLMDPRDILYSMPTISDELAPLTPVTARLNETDFAFHEDEWRQIEFYSADRLTDIQQVLTELSVFEQENRHNSGWRNIYVRAINPSSLLSGPGAVEQLGRLLEAEPGAAPILVNGGGIVGRVSDGFTLTLADTVTLYGIQSPDGISVLGANFTAGGGDAVLIEAFSALNTNHGLLLVDWRAQMLFVGTEQSGQISVWQP